MTTSIIVAVGILRWLLYIYMLVLLGRIVIDWIFFFSRDLRPKGIVLVVVNLIYAITDPPMKFFSRLIPPLRLGAIGLDLGVLVLFFVIYVLQIILGYIPFMLL